jgi:Spy/CpxP family protein refolding chaperone
MLAQRLDLNEAQISKVKALYDDQDKKMREARTAAAGNPAELRDKLGKIREETRAKMKDILTPEQWEKFSTPRSSRPKPAPTDAAPAK